MRGAVFGGGQFAGTGDPSLEFLLRPWAWPSARDLAFLLAAGACSATGGYLMSQACRSSAAGLVAPFEYVSLVLAAFWGFAIWGEVPGFLSTIGILLILASGVFVAAREGWREFRAQSRG